MKKVLLVNALLLLSLVLGAASIPNPVATQNVNSNSVLVVPTQAQIAMTASVSRGVVSVLLFLDPPSPIAVDFQIYDMTRKPIMNLGQAFYHSGENAIRFDVSSLRPGAYVLVATIGGNSTSASVRIARRIMVGGPTAGGTTPSTSAGGN